MNAPYAIRRLRLTLGLTQAAFAVRIGVSRQTVVRWERGRCKPLPAFAARLDDLERQDAQA